MARVRSAGPSDPRELVLAGLSRSYAEGRIPMRELERRVSGVLASRSSGDLIINAGVAPVAPVAKGLTARFVRRFQRFALRAHGVFLATVAAGSAALFELAGGHSLLPALLVVPAAALFGVHAYASRRLTRSLDRRRWDL